MARYGKGFATMNSRLRNAGKRLLTLLAVLTLIGQSVLPVCADTVDTGKDTSASGYTVSEEKDTYILGYFDRIAVNSVKGTLTIRPGEDFSISFPAGVGKIPSFSVQDEILVVSGRKSAQEQEQAEKSSNGSVVVLGEDEPAEGSAAQYHGSAQSESAAAEETAAQADTGTSADIETSAAAEEAAENETAAESEEITPEIVITIPSGVGIDTMRIAMEEGSLIITNITANAVTIQSGGGDLVMKDVSLGTVDIYSDTGSISLAECIFNSLNVGMGGGNVAVQSDDSLARCRMEIETENGEITYNGASKGGQYMQPGNGKRFLTIQVGSGNINING